MNFNIPMRTTGAMNSQTLAQQKGRIKSGICLQRATNQNFMPSASQPVSRQNIPANPVPKSSARLVSRTVMSASQNSPIHSGTGTFLRKGQKISVSESYIRIGLGWEVLNPQCELDASSFMLNQNQVVLNDDWFVFYGQPASPDRTVQYHVNQNGQDKALIDVQIANLRPDVQKIVFAVTIYEAMERRLNFSMTRNVYGRILNSRNQEIARFDLTDCSSEVTAMVIGELYRYQGAWKFNAVGSGVARDLPAFCGMYGVNFEIN